MIVKKKGSSFCHNFMDIMLTRRVQLPEQISKLFNDSLNKVIDTRVQVQGVWCTREQPPSTSQRFICLRQNWLLRSIVSEPSAQITL